jgi:hypothetical protein
MVFLIPSRQMPGQYPTIISFHVRSNSLLAQKKRRFYAMYLEILPTSLNKPQINKENGRLPGLSMEKEPLLSILLKRRRVVKRLIQHTLKFFVFYEYLQ